MESTITLNTGTTLSITPLFDNDIAFDSMKLYEVIGGPLPEIEIKVRTTSDCCKVGDVLRIKLVNETGWINEFDAYIYKLDYLNTNMTINLTSCNPEFTRNVNSETYNGVREVLNATYKYNIDSNADPDLVDTLELYQMNMTNYKFLNEIMYGYRKDIAWGYSSGALMIRDLQNWKEEYRIDRQEETTIVEAQSISNPKKLEYDVEVLEEFTNFVKIKFGKNIIDVDKRYLDLIENRMHNSKYTEIKSKYKFPSRNLLPIVICSNVTLYSSETDVENCYITSREIDIRDSDFICTYELSSVNP